jgi:UDP:flavonoid glycosyltransferase YjiC (YdhE family)
LSRFLLAPGNNTLSHIGKCLAIREALLARGHEVVVSVAQSRAKFLERMGVRDYVVVPDVQEVDGAASPSFAWFRPERFEACVRAEIDVLERLKPDLVLGVFRFTGPLSAQLADIPYDTLVCGSITPVCDEVLGFRHDEPGADDQAQALKFFRESCARRVNRAIVDLGLAPVDDIWQLLIGRRTFLWDFPEFQPLPSSPDYRHVGPVHWAGWPKSASAEAMLARLAGPIAFVAFGTGSVSPRMLRRLVDALWSMGYSVALALGGQTHVELPADPSRLAVFDFLPVEQALACASLVVCHGGQGLVFEAMQQRIPSFVLPLQPEQAQNGVCVERMGCGRRLLKGVVYKGDNGDVEDAFLTRHPDALTEDMANFLGTVDLPARLDASAGAVMRYNGVDTVAAALEQYL